MKKIISLILALCMCTAIAFTLASCNSVVEEHMGFKVISGDINDFVLYVPSEYTETNQNGYVSATANGQQGDSSNVSVMSSLLGEGMETPEQYYDKLVESYGEMYDNVETLQRDIDTKLGDKNAKKYVFTADVLGNSYKFMQVLCVYGERIYIFTYTSTDEFYEIHETEVKYILEYFEFKV
jgi:hypothetical protein